MKKIFVIPLLIFSFPVIACQKLDTQNYSFQYDYTPPYLTYKINAKNNKDIKYLNMDGVAYNLSNGFLFFNKAQYSVPENQQFTLFLSNELNQKDPNFNINNLYNFLNENKTLYTDYLLSGQSANMYSYPFNRIVSKDYKIEYLIDKKIISDKIDIPKFVNRFRQYYPESNKYGVQKIIFQVKLPQDIWAKGCLIFQTAPIEVSLPTKFSDKVDKFKQIFKNNQE